jgi:hypothetical protein
VVGRKIMDKFDNGELYQQLMDEILSISNVAYLTQTMEPHLKERLKKSSKKAMFMLNDDEDHPDFEKQVNGMEYLAEADKERT